MVYHLCNFYLGIMQISKTNPKPRPNDSYDDNSKVLLLLCKEYADIEAMNEDNQVLIYCTAWCNSTEV